MASELWMQLKPIFDELKDKPPEKRDTLLTERCGSNLELRLEIESLLRHHDKMSTFLHSPAMEMDFTLTGPEGFQPEGKMIGHYCIKKVISSGGMGIVYEAEQKNPRRTVALKVMKRGIATRSALRRFQFESQILGRLRHPGIAQIFEAGIHIEKSDTGEESRIPYFAMEYIPGAQTITEYVEAKHHKIRDRLRLFLAVCDAVAHGHRKGIIHRDLKPANILVDSNGLPKLIDYGVARATDPDLVVTTQLTDMGQLIGTVQYMSPEQCDADPHDLDIRSDVYSLGVVMYELFCRRLPYDASSIKIYKAMKAIKEDKPVKPSSIDKKLGSDIDIIIMKALEKDRRFRYQSAGELGLDIRRYLSGNSILARPPSLGYQLLLFARRYKALFITFAVSIIVLLFATLLLILNNLKLMESKEIIVFERDKAYLTNAQFALSNHDIAFARNSLDEVSEEHRGWEWHYLDKNMDYSIATLMKSKEEIRTLAYSNDGELIAAGYGKTISVWNSKTYLLCCSLPSLEKDVLSVTFGICNGTRKLAACSFKEIVIWNMDNPAEPIKEIELPVKDKLKNKENIMSVLFQHDGKKFFVATAGVSNTVQVWDLETEELEYELKGHTDDVCVVVSSPSGTCLASGSQDKTIRLWNTDATGVYKGAAVLKGHRALVTSLSFSYDGNWLASGSIDGTVKIWDVQNSIRKAEENGYADSGVELAAIQSGEEWINCIAFSPDSQFLAFGGEKRVLSIWSIENQAILCKSSLKENNNIVLKQRQFRMFAGHCEQIKSMAFRPDSKNVVTGSTDGEIKIWNVYANDSMPTLNSHLSSVFDLDFSPDDMYVASGAGDYSVRLWDLDTCEEVSVLWHPYVAIRNLDFHESGKFLASACSNDDINVGELLIWKLKGVEDKPEIFLRYNRCQGNDYAWSVAFSPDGKWIAAGYEKGDVLLWRFSESGISDKSKMTAHKGRVNCIAFSHDSRLVASGSNDCTVHVCEVKTGKEVYTLKGHTDEIMDVAFSKDLKWIASASKDKNVMLWDGITGEYRYTFSEHTDQVLSLAFIDEDRFGNEKLVSSSMDRTLMFLNLDKQKLVTALQKHQGHIRCVRWNNKRKMLATAATGLHGKDNTVKLWEIDKKCRDMRAEINRLRFALKSLVEELFSKYYLLEVVESELASRIDGSLELNTSMRMANSYSNNLWNRLALCYKAAMSSSLPTDLYSKMLEDMMYFSKVNKDQAVFYKHLVMGMTLYRNRNYLESIKELNQAKLLNTDWRYSIIIYAFLSMNYSQLGKEEELQVTLGCLGKLVEEEKDNIGEEIKGLILEVNELVGSCISSESENRIENIQIGNCDE